MPMPMPMGMGGLLLLGRVAPGLPTCLGKSVRKRWDARDSNPEPFGNKAYSASHLHRVIGTACRPFVGGISPKPAPFRSLSLIKGKASSEEPLYQLS